MQEAGFEVVGKVGTADELLRKVELTRPDVAIVDISMPPTHTDEGIVAAQEIRRSHLRSACSFSAPPGVALRHATDRRHPGGAGYLLKQRLSNLGVLTDALGRLRDGECIIDPTIVARLVSAPPRQKARRAHRARAGGSRPDGRGPLEQGDLRTARQLRVDPW